MTHFMLRICQIQYPKLHSRQSVKTVAYLWVSTAQQDVHSQRLAVLKYARKHDFLIDDFIEATRSKCNSNSDRSTTPTRRSGL